VAIARTYHGYGRPLAEITAEGNISLLQAVSRFDPDRGCRLTTYAICWIRAVIMDYIMRSWSLVKLGTTGAQRKLFFNLRRLNRALRAAARDAGLFPEQTE